MLNVRALSRLPPYRLLAFYELCFVSQRKEAYTYWGTCQGGGGGACANDFLVSVQLERQAKSVLLLPNSLFVHIKKTHFEIAACCLLPTFLFSVVCLRESIIKASPKQSFCARYRESEQWGLGLWKSFLLRVPEKSERAKSIFYSHTLDHC